MTREGCPAHADRVLVGADRAQDEGMGDTLALRHWGGGVREACARGQWAGQGQAGSAGARIYTTGAAC